MVGANMTSGQGLVANLVVRRSEGFNLDINLSIRPGSTAALLGPNGSGKSTTVDALAGIIAIDAGRIELDGRVLDDAQAGIYEPSENRRVGVVFQRYLLFDHLDVIDNIAFGPAASGRRRREARAIAHKWIDALDLGELAHRHPDQLSGGQAQRVALARALATAPDLLLLDEPLAALDIATRTRLRQTLASHLEDFAGPRLMITHDPADAFLLADQVHILEDGRISQTGTPDDIRRRPATPYVAALAGLNLLTGSNAAGTLTLDDHPQKLQSANTHTAGRVLITIAPNAIALHTQQPHGSPRNAWQTSIATIEPLGEITRVTLDRPVPLSVDITPGARESMGLIQGTEIWASVKATEIHLNPA
ncbi:MAG: ATP-binding cassette domain-containing protein [Actinomycetia bacterium]|nr:ATP-binding cassette domain-containing protein [Actinomycetes bacterium]MCP4959556.1 ATP-binding cassette domain-containing protein [Actinomycetes bacterium]